LQRVTLIETNPPLPGFTHFIGAWLCSGRPTMLVDVGPANTVASLIRDLSAMDVQHIDYVLLTHIHIDHAGALAQFLEHYPMARVICHEKAVNHLTDPSKLWKGSRQTLGKIADGYGAPQPVSHTRLIPHTQVTIPDLAVIETPGHSNHHLSFSWRENLFAGEAAGNYYSWGNGEYLRPATPPRFFLELFLSSVDRLTALSDQPIHYAHFGKAPSSRNMLTRFRKQVLQWYELVRDTCGHQYKDQISTCVDRLLETDPELAAFNNMETDVQNRERYFIGNSVKGFIDFLR